MNVHSQFISTDIVRGPIDDQKVAIRMAILWQISSPKGTRKKKNEGEKERTYVTRYNKPPK